jgi:hypothetical protein
MRQFFDRMRGELRFWSLSDMNNTKEDLEALDSGNATPIMIVEPLPNGQIF